MIRFAISNRNGLHHWMKPVLFVPQAQRVSAYKLDEQYTHSSYRLWKKD